MSGTLRRARVRGREVLRDEGFAGLRLRALDATVYRYLVMVSRPVPPASPAGGEAADDSDVEFSFLDVADAPAYAELRPDSSPAETERRLLAGHRCLVGRRDGEIVHARWLSAGRLESAHLGLSFDLYPGVVYGHDIFTAASARKLGISVTAPRHYEAIMREEGVHTLLGSVWPGNTAGMRMVRAQGHWIEGTLGALRVGRARIGVRRWMAPGRLGAAHRFDPPSDI